MTTLDTSASAWRAAPDRAAPPVPLTAREREMAYAAGDAAVEGHEEEDGFRLFGNDGFTFLDFIDIINPLQHIPFVGNFYREMTGDEIDPGSRVLGSTLFFGPVGTVASAANVLVEDSTGKDIGEHVMAFFTDAEDLPEKPEPINASIDGTATPAGEVVAMNAPPASEAAVDPVTAWAQSEMAYRKAKSAKHQAAMESRPATLAAASAAAWEQGTDVGLAPMPVPAPAIVAAKEPAEVAALASRIRADARLRAADEYGMDRPKAYARTTEKAPDGAVAPAGGWFSQTMLTALDRYQTGAAQGDAGARPVVDLKH